MVIDFDKPEGRLNYLQSKLDDLLEGINESYGVVLLDELISRLETTIVDFNAEVVRLMSQLKANQSRKIKLLEDLKSAEDREPGEGAEPGEPETTPQEAPPREISAWEQRLEELSSQQTGE